MNIEKQIPKFKEISEIINDPYFLKFLKQEIDRIKSFTKLRPLPPSGYKYKRSAIDRIESISVEYFVANIEDIWMKRSKLSSEIRNLISEICNNALIQTMAFYNQNNNHETEM